MEDQNKPTEQPQEVNGEETAHLEDAFGNLISLRSKKFDALQLVNMCIEALRFLPKESKTKLREVPPSYTE